MLLGAWSQVGSTCRVLQDCNTSLLTSSTESLLCDPRVTTSVELSRRPVLLCLFGFPWSKKYHGFCREFEPVVSGLSCEMTVRAGMPT